MEHAWLINSLYFAALSLRVSFICSTWDEVSDCLRPTWLPRRALPAFNFSILSIALNINSYHCITTCATQTEYLESSFPITTKFQLEFGKKNLKFEKRRYLVVASRGSNFNFFYFFQFSIDCSRNFFDQKFHFFPFFAIFRYFGSRTFQNFGKLRKF